MSIDRRPRDAVVEGFPTRPLKHAAIDVGDPGSATRASGARCPRWRAGAEDRAAEHGRRAGRRILRIELAWSKPTHSVAPSSDSARCRGLGSIGTVASTVSVATSTDTSEFGSWAAS